jgi:type IV secretion system protein TrbL
MYKKLLLVGLLLALPIAAQAQQVAGIDNLLTQFQTVTAGWGGRLQALALGTFGLLAIIDLFWFVGYRTLRNGGQINDIFYALVGELVFIGFFLFVLTQYNVLGPLIIQALRFAAQQAGGIPMQPNAIFAEGIQIADTIIAQIKFLHPAEGIGLVLCGVIIEGCFALITASMVMVLVESYFIVSAGQILLMFGGSRFTADMAQALLRQCLGIGLKLFILQLIASVGVAFIAQWVAAAGGAQAVGFQNIMIEIGQSIILLAITLTLPGRFERMVTHVGSGGWGDLAVAGGAMGAAGMMISQAVTRGVIAAGGAGATAGAAGRLAATQLAVQQAQGGGPTTAAGRAARLVSSTVGNVASAAATDVVRGLEGSRSRLGSPAWRMAADLKERKRLIDEGP